MNKRAVCLLSLGGEAYTTQTLQNLVSWQASSALSLEFIILDTPEAVNTRILGLAGRSEDYFIEAIRTLDWPHQVSTTTYSVIENESPLVSQYVSQIARIVKSNRFVRDKLRQQTFSSLYPVLRELGIRNQRHAAIDRLTEYLIMEFALLAAAKERGVGVEVSFHNRGEVLPCFEDFGIMFPDHVVVEGRSRETGLEVRGLRFRIPGTARELGPLSFSVQPGQVLAIAGANGVGKSTLLRAIAGHIPIRSGSVSLAGSDVTNLSPYRRRIVTLFQDGGLVDGLSARKNVAVGATVGRERDAASLLDLSTKYRRLNVDEARGTPAGKLSGGERQSVAFLRTLAASPSCILLDEPTASLDRVRHDRLIALLKEEVAARNISVVLVSHDISFAYAVANRLLILGSAGTAREEGPINKFAEGAGTLEGAEILGLRNVFRLSISEDSDDGADDWLVVELARLQAPAGAKGLRIPRDAISCRERGQWSGASRFRGDQLEVAGTIVSRRQSTEGDYIFVVPESHGEVNRGRLRSGRGLWLPKGTSDDLTSMRIILRIRARDIQWLY